MERALCDNQSVFEPPRKVGLVGAFRIERIAQNVLQTNCVGVARVGFQATIQVEVEKRRSLVAMRRRADARLFGSGKSRVEQVCFSLLRQHLSESIRRGEME